MKTKQLSTLLVLFFLSFVSSFAISGTNNLVNPSKNKANIKQQLQEENKSLKTERKLNFVQKFALRVVGKKLKKKTKKDGGEKASKISKAALILGIISISCIFLPFVSLLGLLASIPAIVTGAIAKDGTKSKSDKFGKIGMGLGIGTLAIGILLIGLLILIFLALLI